MGLDSLVRINNQTFGWSSSLFHFDGQGIEGITDVEYEEKREIERAYAAKPDGMPVAWVGGGKITPPTFKVTMLKDSWLVLQAYLATGGLLGPGAGSYGDAQFAFSMQCVEPVIGSVPITGVAAPCRIVGKREKRSVDDPKALMTELEIASLMFIENGIPLWSVVRQALSI